VRRESRDLDRSRLLAAAESGSLLYEMPKVTIAAIDGGCAGAGMALALAADLRIAADTAVFNTAYIAAGLSGDCGLIWFLTRIVGAAKARQMCLTGEKFDAQRALELGVTNDVVPATDLAAQVDALATRIAARAPLALQGMKANFNLAERTSLREYLGAEADRLLTAAYSSDADEAAAAFIDKRVPKFTGAPAAPLATLDARG
jgi:2-(1,2-epoxy-1,2-dihydrophenyl)acetyl-CoA isomerase